ncbi:hypothetical protein [Sphingobacterium yanglingense]|uniref:Uncharacterized protein n=1 Tax=Sphingobacterium yanglingense TaxID=1437280 RepID=A0A4R6WDL1_9SPHI|nr:hypothetical protein [Sphingobacterium yanglingense]TDQ75427.1 hypothetical protein CLV99_4032 [Sphingobacterium yanglingense]
MMKNTQKKLKAKQFRYLNKDTVKNPMIYIHNFYRYETNVIYWMNNINLFIQAGCLPEMADRAHAETGFHCKQMIEQIEIAYVIFKQCHIPKQKNPLQFVAQREDHFNYTHNLEYTWKGKRAPYDTISKFFSYQSLNKWYTTMDDLMIYMSTKESSYYDKFGDKILAIKELLIRLAFALYYIYEDKHLQISVPSYVKAEPAPVHEGKSRLSKLGELIHDSIDKQYEEKERKEKEEAEKEAEESKEEEQIALEKGGEISIESEDSAK